MDLNSGEIVHLDSGRSFLSKPVPDFMMEIIQAGGLVNYVKKKGFV